MVSIFTYEFLNHCSDLEESCIKDLSLFRDGEGFGKWVIATCTEINKYINK